MIRCGAHVIHALSTLNTLYKFDLLLRLQTRTAFLSSGICGKMPLFHSFSVIF